MKNIGAHVKQNCLKNRKLHGNIGIGSGKEFISD